MILISDEIRARFPALGADVDECNEFVRGHEERFVDRFVPAESADLALDTREKAVVLQRNALARARMLVWTINHCINADLAVGCFLALRAHFEMTGVLAYALREVKKWRAGQLSEIDLDDTLVKLILARRVAFSPEEKAPPSVTAVNVLTLLDAVDTVFVDSELKGKFRGGYEWLSEFCHPNFYAHAISGFRRDGRVAIFDSRPRPDERDLHQILGHAAISMGMFLHCHDELGERLKP